LTSLAGALKAAGHTVAVFNADLLGSLYASDLDVLRAHWTYLQRLQDESDPVWRGVPDRLQQWAPDVVGVHVKTPSWASGRMVARIAKDALPSVTTLCGGPHVSCLPSDVGAASEFDYGIRGEGELATMQLLAAVSEEDRVRIPGLIRARDESATRLDGLCPLIENLDELPFNGREALLDIDKYEKLGLGVIMTARGCPFQCEYCASLRTWTRKVRYRSPENVLAEIDYLVRRYGVTYFEFCDDTFTVNKKRAHRICDMIRSRGQSLRWKCTTRADCLDEVLADKMRASGCLEVSVGVESGSPRILERIRKGETTEDIARGCQILRESGIPFVAFVMIGFPTESEDEAWRTFEFAKSLGADSLCGSVVTPYPGTELYSWAKEAGKLPDEPEWRDFYHQSDAMGLWDVPPERARTVINTWFRAIERYNHRTSRLARRFIGKFRSDPIGTMRRSGSVLWRRLTKPLGTGSGF